jgi:hypothetical protein
MIALSCQFRYCYFGDFAFFLNPMKRIARRFINCDANWRHISSSKFFTSRDEDDDEGFIEAFVCV